MKMRFTHSSLILLLLFQISTTPAEQVAGRGQDRTTRAKKVLLSLPKITVQGERPLVGKIPINFSPDDGEHIRRLRILVSLPSNYVKFEKLEVGSVPANGKID